MWTSAPAVNEFLPRGRLFGLTLYIYGLLTLPHLRTAPMPSRPAQIDPTQTDAHR